MPKETTSPAKVSWSLFGPLFGYELVRLGRRGGNVVLRCAYAGLLLLTLFLAHREWWHSGLTLQGTQETTAQTLARLGQEMTTTILIAQLVAILVLTPLYVAGAVVEERKRGTLDLLFTTHLTSREIVFGKLFARVLALGLVLLFGLPVLALVQFWGGTSGYVVVAGYACAAITLVHAGAVSMYFSVRSKGYGEAVFLSYGALGVFLVCCCPIASFTNPFMFLYEIPARLSGSSYMWGISSVPSTWHPVWIVLGLIGEFAIFQSVFIFLYLYEAVRRLRNIEKMPRLAPVTEADWVKLDRPDRVAREKDPLWWKELALRENGFANLFVGVSLSLTVYTGYVLSATMAASGLMLLAGRRPDEHTLGQWNEFFRLSWTGMVAVMGALIAWQTAGSVTHDREKRTLESWLTLPYTKEYLFRVKGLAAVRGLRFAAGGMVVLVVWESLIGVLHPLAAVLLVAAAGAHLLFLAGLGMWLSTVCRSSNQAYLILGGVVVGLVAGSWYFLPPGWEPVLAAVNPLVCWKGLGFPWTEFQESGAGGVSRATLAVLSGCTGLVVYAGAAGLVWHFAHRRFVVETDRILDGG